MPSEGREERTACAKVERPFIRMERASALSWIEASEGRVKDSLVAGDLSRSLEAAAMRAWSEPDWAMDLSVRIAVGVASMSRRSAS